MIGLPMMLQLEIIACSAVPPLSKQGVTGCVSLSSRIQGTAMLHTTAFPASGKRLFDQFLYMHDAGSIFARHLSKLLAFWISAIFSGTTSRPRLPRDMMTPSDADAMSLNANSDCRDSSFASTCRCVTLVIQTAQSSERIINALPCSMGYMWRHCPDLHCQNHMLLRGHKQTIQQAGQADALGDIQLPSL